MQIGVKTLCKLVLLMPFFSECQDSCMIHTIKKSEPIQAKSWIPLNYLPDFRILFVSTVSKLQGAHVHRDFTDVKEVSHGFAASHTT